MSQNLTTATESKGRLDNLSKSFKPTDVSFLLALNSDFSIEQCIDDAEGMISRLQRFIENGHTSDGLDFTYTEARGF